MKTVTDERKSYFMDDKDIVKMYWDRNENAIAETSSKYGGYCHTIAMNILNDPEDTEECVNDTYLNAWNSMPPHKPSMLSAFLGKITRNLSFNRYKAKRTAKRGNGEIEIILDELAEIVSDKENVEDKMIRGELLHAIDLFLGTLSGKGQGIFIRRYWYSDSVKSIAEMYYCSENTVSVTLSRIRRQLKKYLNERGYDI